MSNFFNSIFSNSSILISANNSLFGLSRSMSRLSSGLKINSAADGPAQLVISEKLRSQIGSLNQEIENTSMQIAKYSTASSTLLELRGQLTDLRTMAIGAANEGGNDAVSQQAYVNTSEFLVENFNRTIDHADYNGFNLVDGSEGSVTNVEDLSGIDFSSSASAEESLAVIDQQIAAVDQSIVEVGSKQANELESTRSSLEITRQNLISAESDIRDTDYLKEITNMLKHEIQAKATLSLLAHSRFNAEVIFSMLK